MDEGGGIAEQEVAGTPERSSRLPRPGELGQVQREADGAPLEARVGEVAGGLGTPAVLAEALLEEAAVRRVAVSHVRPALAATKEREDPEVAAVLEVEQEHVIPRRVREAAGVLANGVDDVVAGHGSGGATHDAPASVGAHQEAARDDPLPAVVGEPHAPHPAVLEQHVLDPGALERVDAEARDRVPHGAVQLEPRDDVERRPVARELARPRIDEELARGRARRRRHRAQLREDLLDGGDRLVRQGVAAHLVARKRRAFDQQQPAWTGVRGQRAHEGAPGGPAPHHDHVVVERALAVHHGRRRCGGLTPGHRSAERSRGLLEDSASFQAPGAPPGLDRLGRDARPQRLVRHPAAGRLHVVPQVRGLRGRRDRARDGGVRDDELQQDLRPARAVDLGGPRRQRLAASAARQRSPPANGRFAITATPRSRASGRSRLSASRSPTE